MQCATWLGDHNTWPFFCLGFGPGMHVDIDFIPQGKNVHGNYDCRLRPWGFGRIIINDCISVREKRKKC